MTTPKGWEGEAERLRVEFLEPDDSEGEAFAFVHIDWCSAGSDVPYMGEGCTCPSYQ